MRTLPILATLLMGMPSLVASKDLELEDGAAPWRVVVDGVMGGRSSGRVTTGESGVLSFTGELSLENNGGFSQVRRPVSGDAFAGADGIEIKVRGDGRTYIFDLRAANARVMAGSYQAQFETVEDTWVTVRMPFEAFRLHSFGRLVSGAPALEPSMIESLGVTLADKVEGQFELEIDSISTYSIGEALPATVNQEVQRLIELSINRGAPLFNDGQHAACATVYEMTIRSIVSLSRAELEDSIVARLEQGLEEGAAQRTWTERAWAYRRAFDDVYTMLQAPAVERTAMR